MTELDNYSLKGEISLITGASRGIGASIADLFGQSNSLVIGTATTPEGAQSISDRFKKLQIKGRGVVLDVSKSEQVNQLVKDLKANNELPSILVNNAGISMESLMMRIKEEDWNKVINTNLSSVFFMTKAVIGGMMKKRHGRIINIGSVVGSIGAVGNAHYSATKSALEGFTKSIALEVGSRGITANTISPGYITTDMTKGINEELNQTMMKKIPLDRFGDPEDIAKAAVFLASDAASMITGTSLLVDGGWTAR